MFYANNKGEPSNVEEVKWAVKKPQSAKATKVKQRLQISTHSYTPHCSWVFKTSLLSFIKVFRTECGLLKLITLL